MTNLLQPEPRQRAALAGHERLDGAIPEMPGLGDATPEIPGLRKLIRESWLRSAGFKANPDNAAAPLAFDWDELEDYRRQHPLAAIMPVINKLLVQPSHDSGL